MDVHFNGESSVRIVWQLRQNLAHVGRDSRETEQTGLIIESLIEIVYVQALVPQQINKHAWVNGAAAGTHHQTLQGRETHRGIDTDAVTDRRHRRAITQMGNNEPQVPPADHLCRPAGAVRMAQSVETVTAHAPFARPLLRHRIGSGRLGQGCVEGRVKRRYLWDLWQDLLDRCNAVQAGRVVERRQLCQFPYRPLDLWRDPHRGGVPLAAVNDAMSYGLEFSEYAQRCRRASLQVVEDASDGIIMFFQLQLVAHLLLTPAAENQPRRFCRPVDAALGQQQLAFSFEEAEFEAAGAGVTNQNFHFCLPHGVPCSYPFGLAPNMASVVPEPDYRLRQVVFVAQRTHARRAEHEVSTERGIEAEPASSKYSEKMRARKDQHITLDSAHAFHHAVCPRANLVRRFSSGAAKIGRAHV